MSLKVNFFWIGSELSKMEQLTLKSFLDHGHTPVLWAYDKNCKNVPAGVHVNDAADILPMDRIFAYTGNGDCREGSYGGFSDLFRYHLLNKVGGWYCDMDVTCLNAFNDIDDREYLFRPHNMTTLVGNIMKAPAGCEFLKDCIVQTEKEITSSNDRWIRPVEILRDCVKRQNLLNFVAPLEWFGNDSANDLQIYVSNVFLSKDSELPRYAIHWCNEAISTGRWNRAIKRNWNVPLPATLFYKLLKAHKLL